MDYLKLMSAKAIMQMVSTNDGKLNWYNIVKAVDQLGYEKVPPSYQVLKELVEHGLLRLDPPEGGNDAKYWLSEAGREFLGQ